MRIIGTRTIDGPNVFTYRPVVLMTLDLQELHERESCDLPGFVERLNERLPGLAEHVCGKDYPGRFVERLREGTYLGHVVEHVAIEWGQATGATGNYGKTVRSARAHCFDVAITSYVHRATRHLLHAAVAFVDATVRGDAFDTAAVLTAARRLVDDTRLGPSTRAIVDAAARRNIPWKRLDDESLVQLGYGTHRRLIRSTVGDATSAIAVEIAQDKAATKALLARAFIPVPEGVVAESQAEALAAFDEIGAPVVLKPLDGNQGTAVSVGVRSHDEVRAAFQLAQAQSPRVIVEQMLVGNDYRILVVGGRVVAASRREPPAVTGDGTRTVRELVAIANQDPRRGEGHEKPLTAIQLDDTALVHLRTQGLDLESVPEEGRTVWLRESANLSTGGTAEDVTERVHPDVCRVCERAARVVGLDICGVDLMTPDISQPLGPSSGIVELNAGPGIRMHHHPSAGAPRNVGDAIVDLLFPDGHDGRIPVIAVTGTNGKTTVARMVAHVLQMARRRVGLTTTDGVWIGGAQVAAGDMTGPRSAQVVLSDPWVDAAVVETARGGIVRSGLGYDWSDVGIMTNIQLDHIGQDGIETLEDLAHIKSLVLERVREGGTLVLNADDAHVMRLMDHPRVRKLRREVRLFSAYPNHVNVRRHLGRGGTAYFPRRGWIVEGSGGAEQNLVKIATIHAVLGGAAQHQLANALAAVAACRAQGLTADQLALSLRTFDAHAHNQGRGNLYRVGHGYVLIDYGHNPAAFEAVGQMSARWLGRRVTAVIGVPGNRADWIIEEAARAAVRAFDRIIVREDADRRGRNHGEVPGLLCAAIASHAPSRPCQVVPSEREALRLAVQGMDPNEVVVVFYEDLAGVQQTLAELGAVRAQIVEPLRFQEDGTLGRLRRA
jgi:cyanophycin synthetase